jgi:hypothetical protein
MSETMTLEQEEKAKAELRAIAKTQYAKLSKSVIFMEKFKLEIKALRKTGHPWSLIAMKLETITKTKISATTLRNYFERKPPGTASKNTRPSSVDAAPNPFEEINVNVETPSGFNKLLERDERSNDQPAAEQWSQR